MGWSLDVDVLQAGIEIAPAAPVSLHALVPVLLPVELEAVGGQSWESTVRQAGRSHLEGVAGIAGGPGGPATLGGINVSQDDPGLGETREVWLGI